MIRTLLTTRNTTLGASTQNGASAALAASVKDQSSTGQYRYRNVPFGCHCTTNMIDLLFYTIQERPQVEATEKTKVDYARTPAVNIVMSYWNFGQPQCGYPKDTSINPNRSPLLDQTQQYKQIPIQRNIHGGMYQDTFQATHTFQTHIISHHLVLSMSTRLYAVARQHRYCPQATQTPEPTPKLYHLSSI